MATRKTHTKPERIDICKNCRFCVYKRGEDLQCRRYPPQLVYESQTGCSVVMFPIVNADNYCGEFAPQLSS